MRAFALACAALVVTTAPASGLAANARQKKSAAMVKEAGRLYEQGKYVQSAELLKKAYQLDASPVLLYNIARAYDQAGDLKQSLEYYRQFVAEEDVDPTLLKRANLAMDRIRALLAKEEAEDEIRRKELERIEAERRAAEEKAQKEAELARKQREEFEARQRAEAEAKQRQQSRGRTLAHASGGVALAGLASGVFFGLSAQGSKGAFQQASDVSTKRQLEAQTRTQALIADVSFGLAVAGAVAAVLLWPKGEAQPEKKEVDVVLSPAGAGISVRF